MNTKTYEQFFDTLDKIIHERGSARSKKAALMAYMGEEEDALIEELLTWFRTKDSNK